VSRSRARGTYAFRRFACAKPAAKVPRSGEVGARRRERERERERERDLTCLPVDMASKRCTLRAYCLFSIRLRREARLCGPLSPRFRVDRPDTDYVLHRRHIAAIVEIVDSIGVHSTHQASHTDRTHVDGIGTRRISRCAYSAIAGTLFSASLVGSGDLSARGTQLIARGSFQQKGNSPRSKCESRSPLDSTDGTSGPRQGRWVGGW
jgi:hypothetical protein